MLQGLFPLLLLPVILYNVIALGGGVLLHHDIQDMLSINHALTITMFSGDKWMFSFGDFLILLTLSLLFVEVVKATRTTSREIVKHGLSMLTFVRGADRVHHPEGASPRRRSSSSCSCACSTWWRATRSRCVAAEATISASAAPAPTDRLYSDSRNGRSARAARSLLPPGAGRARLSASVNIRSPFAQAAGTVVNRE